MNVNWNQVDGALAALPTYGDKAGTVLAEHEQMVAKIQAEGAWTNDHKRELIEKAKEVPIGVLQGLRAAIGSQVDLIDLNRPAALGSDDPTYELKAVRAWARAEKMLDGGVPIQTVIASAVEAQDSAMLLALREEYPSRLITQTQEMDAVGRAGTIERFHQHLSLAIVTGFPGTDEGRWLAAKMQADLLSQIAQTQVRVALNSVQAGSNASTMEDAVSLSLTKRDLVQLQQQIASTAKA